MRHQHQTNTPPVQDDDDHDAINMTATTATTTIASHGKILTLDTRATLQTTGRRCKQRFHKRTIGRPTGTCPQYNESTHTLCQKAPAQSIHIETPRETTATQMLTRERCRNGVRVEWEHTQGLD